MMPDFVLRIQQNSPEVSNGQLKYPIQWSQNFVLTQLEYLWQITGNLKFHFPIQTINSWKPRERLLIRICLVSNKKNPLEELSTMGSWMRNQRHPTAHRTGRIARPPKTKARKWEVTQIQNPHTHTLWGYRNLCCYFIPEHLPSTSTSALSALALTWPNICLQLKWKPSSVPSTTSKWPEETSD